MGRTGLNPINRCCQILNALDKQNRNYPAKLWGLILSKSIMILSYEGAPVNPDGWTRFAVDFVEKLIVKIKTNDPSIQEDLRKDLGFDITKMEETYKISSARELASHLFGQQGEIGRFFMEAIREVGDYVGKKNLTQFAKVVDKVRTKAEKILSPEKLDKFKKTYQSIVKLGAILWVIFRLLSIISERLTRYVVHKHIN